MVLLFRCGYWGVFGRGRWVCCLFAVGAEGWYVLLLVRGWWFFCGCGVCVFWSEHTILQLKSETAALISSLPSRTAR